MGSDKKTRDAKSQPSCLQAERHSLEKLLAGLLRLSSDLLTSAPREEQDRKKEHKSGQAQLSRDVEKAVMGHVCHRLAWRNLFIPDVHTNASEIIQPHTEERVIGNHAQGTPPDYVPITYRLIVI